MSVWCAFFINFLFTVDIASTKPIHLIAFRPLKYALTCNHSKDFFE